MGTRSTTRFTVRQKEDGKLTKAKTLLAFYRQMDGYPSGHGLELAESLSSFKLVNGYSHGTKEKQANGVGCLVAQVLTELKDGVGNIYIIPDESSAFNEEYHYEISMTEERSGFNTYSVNFDIKVKGYDGEQLFKGSLPKFLKFCKDN